MPECTDTASHVQTVSGDIQSLIQLAYGYFPGIKWPEHEAGQNSICFGVKE
jgi:hypothetical protein